MKIPDSVCAAYVAEAVRMHGSAGGDIGDTVKGPDSGVKVGKSPRGDVWRLVDGWGEYYFLDPPKGEAVFMACKMPDVMACDVSPAYKDVIPYKELGMGDKAWDAAAVKAVEGELMTTAEKSIDWTSEYVNALPDSAFAFIEPGGVKDAVGKTSPRSLRHLPFKRAEGDVDFEQLAKSISGVETTNLPAKTKSKILAKLEGIVAKNEPDPIEKTWSDAAREAAALARKQGYGKVGPGNSGQYSHPQGHQLIVRPNGDWTHTHTGAGTQIGQGAGALQDRFAATQRYDIVHPTKAAIEKYITHAGDKWQVHSEAGKVLGTHDSKEDAVAQLGAIEANKHPKEKDVHWPVDDSRFRGSSLTDAGEKAPNQKKGAGDAFGEKPNRFKPQPDELDKTAKEDDFEARYEAFRAQVKTASGPGSKVQTLIFDKEKYPKVKEATGWATDHGFKAGKVDETQDSFRLRQDDPSQFVRMRTISLTEGVQAVIGFPKKSVNAVKEAFFTTETGRLAFKAKAADLYKTEFAPIRETDGWTFYEVKYAGKSLFFAEQNGTAQYLPSYELLTKSEWVTIIKSSDEQRYTLSVVYPCSKKGTPEPDFHGDVMSEIELEKSAWSFLEKGNDRIGLMHRPGTTGAGKIVESYIWRGPEWKMKDAGGVDQSVSPGDWVMGIVWTEPAWQAIKSGTIIGLSLQGAARKEAF